MQGAFSFGGTRHGTSQGAGAAIGLDVLRLQEAVGGSSMAMCWHYFEESKADGMV